MKRECKRRKYEGPERAELSRGPKKSASTSDGNVSAKGHILIPRTSFPFHFHSRMLALHCNGLLREKGKRTREYIVFRIQRNRNDERKLQYSTVHCHIYFFPSSSVPRGRPILSAFLFLFLYYYCCFHSTPFLAEFSFEPICIEPLSDLAFQCSAQLIAPSL